jgi:hypothetical protein
MNKNIVGVLVCMTPIACAACGTEPFTTPAGSVEVHALLVSCAVPGATPNDGLDDRAAIQAALDTQHCAYLPAGIYDIDTPGVVPPGRRIYSMLTVASASLYGDGEVTRLRFRGDASGQDWRGVQLTGAGSSLHDAALDTSAITNTDEQTHAVLVYGAAGTSDDSIYRTAINHPARAGEHGGDCIQIVGYAGSEATNPHVYANHLVCDRSGVAIHSGAVGLAIEDNDMCAGDQAIDGEGSGGSGNWLIARNNLRLGAAPQGTSMIGLQLTNNVRITDNQLNGQGVAMYSASDVEIDHNTIVRSVSGDDAGAIEIIKDSSRIDVHDNTLTRASTAGTGAVIRTQFHTSASPDHLTVSDNVITQNGLGDMINTSGMVGLYVQHNTLTYAGPPNVMAGINTVGVPVRTTEIVVLDNTWSGPLAWVVRVTGSHSGTGTVTMADNTASGAVGGLKCESVDSGGQVLGPISSTHDAMPLPVCGPPGFVEIH